MSNKESGKSRNTLNNSMIERDKNRDLDYFSQGIEAGGSGERSRMAREVVAGASKLQRSRDVKGGPSVMSLFNDKSGVNSPELAIRVDLT